MCGLTICRLTDRRTPLFLSDDLFMHLDVAYAQYQELVAAPFAAQDGSIVANVSYYGAVSANCAAVEEAYEFLKLLLSREVPKRRRPGIQRRFLRCQRVGDGSWLACAVRYHRGRASGGCPSNSLGPWYGGGPPAARGRGASPHASGGILYGSL